VLRKSGDRLLVVKDAQTLLEVELTRLTSVVLLSTVQVTTQALCALLEAGLELALITAQGKLLGQLTPPLARNLALRRAQYQKETEELFTFRLARTVTVAKLSNQAEVLRRYSWDQSGAQPAVEEATARIERTLSAVETVSGLEQLRGLEGTAAAAYWSAFSTLVHSQGFVFTGREYHPPPDPVNALLSFGYALLTNLLTSALDAYGFDPFLGFFHAETYGHPSLALDLVEPFRAPVVDRMVLRLLGLRMLAPSDFEPSEEGGVRMNDRARESSFVSGRARWPG